MKVDNGFCCDLFLDVEIAAGRHVNILAITGLLLVESLLKGKLNCTTKVFLAQAILHGRHHRLISPSRLVLAKEAILELSKGVSPAKMDLLVPLVKVGDDLVISELNTKFSTVLVDFGFCFTDHCSATCRPC